MLFDDRFEILHCINVVFIRSEVRVIFLSAIFCAIFFCKEFPAEYLNILDTIDVAKISVVYKKAIGVGYSLFASKSVGFDYTCAFANARIALFDDVQGAKIELSNNQGVDENELATRYAEENSDPMNAAKEGYLDAIIEPQFVKQYLIASLQMLAK